MSTLKLSSASKQDASSFSLIKQLSSSKFPIYLVEDTQNNQKLAIKTFSTYDHRYLKEKEILVNLCHPHIVELHKAVDSAVFLNGEYNSYMCLEYAANGDLFEVISQHGKFSEILARSLFYQLIDAVAYLHEQNIAHLDLKIENLLIDENFDLKVTDFDLAQLLSSEKLDGRGTPGSRAPEIKKGICGDLRAADVYSSAIILFIMITGYPPYQEVSKGFGLEFDSYYRAMRRQNSRFWEAHTRNKRDPNLYSKEFKELIGRMMEEEPEKRATIEEIRESEWFKGPRYDKERCRIELKNYMNLC